MERDWYQRVMLKLADARETRPEEFLAMVDSELDEVIMRLEDLRVGGGMSSFGIRRGLNILNELRGRLESARNGQEVRAAFLALDEVRDLVADALQVIDDRDEKR